MSSKRARHSFFPKDEERGISLLEAVAYASSDELADLEAKLDRLVTRVAKANPSRGTRKKLASLVAAGRMSVTHQLDKRRRVQVWAQWTCFQHRVTVNRKRHEITLVALIVEIEDRCVVGLAKSPIFSKLPDETLGAVWTKELHCPIYAEAIGSALYGWAQRIHNDRVAVPLNKLRAWTALTLFKWNPTTQAAFPVEIA